MTYNFDPDRWLAMQVGLLEERRRRGELADDEYSVARRELEQRHEAMVERLDGSYRLPRATRGSRPSGDGPG